MEIHRLVTLSIRAMLHETGIAPLDLDTAASFLLDVLDVSTPMTNDLCSQIETWDGLEVDGYTLFRPFTLLDISNRIHERVEPHTRPNSSRSTWSGSRRLNRRSSTRFGSSCIISSLTFSTAFSRPSLDVLVMWRNNGGA